MLIVESSDAKGVPVEAIRTRRSSFRRFADQLNDAPSASSVFPMLCGRAMCTQRRQTVQEQAGGRWETTKLGVSISCVGMHDSLAKIEDAQSESDGSEDLLDTRTGDSSRLSSVTSSPSMPPNAAVQGPRDVHGAELLRTWQ